MQNVSVARRYARALLDAAGASADKVSEQLVGFSHAIDEHAELREVLINPAYTRAQRMQVIDALLGQVPGLEQAFQNLIRLLVDRNRLELLGDIARIYRDLADLRAGRLRGKVTSAVPLADEMVSRIERSLEKVTQRDVVLERAVDPAVLGGVSAQVGSLLYDGTLRTQLEELKRSLGG